MGAMLAARSCSKRTLLLFRSALTSRSLRIPDQLHSDAALYPGFSRRAHVQSTVVANISSPGAEPAAVPADHPTSPTSLAVHIKCLVYLADEHDPILVIVRSPQDRVSERALCEVLDLSRKRCRLAPESRLVELCGFAAGQVPPYGHPTPLFTIVDSHVAAAVAVLPGGDTNETLSGEELVARANARIAPVTTSLAAPLGQSTSHPAAVSKSHASVDPLPQPWTEPSYDGSVYFYCVVGSARRVAKLLLFMPVLPESVLVTQPGDEEREEAHDTVITLKGIGQVDRRAWAHPDTALPCELQLILGKTLEKRFGAADTAALFKRLRPGQRLWVRGVPQTPAPAAVANKHSQGLDVVVHDIEILSDAPPPLPLTKKKVPVLLPKVSRGPAADDYTGSVYGDDIAEERLVFVDTLEGLRLAAAELGNSAVVGLDAEWQPYSASARWTPVSLLQVATSDTAFVIDMLTLCARDQPPVGSDTDASNNSHPEVLTEAQLLLSELLQKLFTDPDITLVGFVLTNDLKRVAESYPWLPCFQPPVNNAPPLALTRDIDLQTLAHVVLRDPRYQRRRMSLSTLTHAVLGAPLDKAQQASSWADRPLSASQIRYAAVDALCLVQLYLALSAAAPEGLLSEDRVRGLSAGVTDVSSLASRAAFIMRANALAAAAVNVRRREIGGLSAEIQLPPPGEVTYAQRPAGSAQNVPCNVALLLSHLGRPLPESGKVGVVKLATTDDAGRTLGRLPRFPRGSGVLEFSNAFLLFVNILSGRYPNKFEPGADGSLEMSWFPGRGQNMQHSGMRRLLSMVPHSTTQIDESGDSGSSTIASSPSTVLLLCRPAKGAFVMCGRLQVAAVEEGNGGETMVKWRVMDEDRLQGSEAFQALLQLQ